MTNSIWKLEFWKNVVEDFLTVFVTTFFAQASFAAEFNLQHLKVSAAGAAGVVLVRAFTVLSGTQGTGRFNRGVHSQRQLAKRQAANEQPDSSASTP